MTERATSVKPPLTEVSRRRVEAMEQTDDIRFSLTENPLLWIQVTNTEDKNLRSLYGGSPDWSRTVDYARKIWWRFNVLPPKQSWWKRMLGNK